MKPLIVKSFQSSNPTKIKTGLPTNTVFKSRLVDFSGRLSDSHYTIKLPITNQERYFVDRREYHIDHNSYFISNADEEIEAVVKNKNGVLGICIGFTKEFILELAASMQVKLENGIDDPCVSKQSFNFILNEHRIENNTLGITLAKIKEELLNSRLSNYESDQFYISLGELLINSEKKIRSDIERLPHIKSSSREEIYRRVYLMNEYIHANFKNSITLDELSKACSLSKYYALRCYQKIYHITPYKKITMLRLEEAKRLIKNGWTISEAAIETNFSDSRSLSKQFKAHFSMTPSQYKTNSISKRTLIQSL